MGFAGDDLIDLPAMTRVGICFAPSDAVAEVKARSDYICCHPGGRGAVREICEAILKARGQWEAAVSGFLP
jgi:3-deoxy-D-manno-octulosonate 8-phosphate phosphatase (KDO 8-P phosphatase)